MADLTAFQILSSAFGVLLTSGGLAWWIRSGTDMKLAQRDAAEARKDAGEVKARQQLLESRVNQQDTIINEIRTRMAKLDRVDEIAASAKFIENAVMQSMVPRSEHEAHWNAEKEWKARIEAEINELSKKS